MLRLADNGADDVAWFRVLQLVEGVGPVERGAALARMGGGGVDPGRVRSRRARRGRAWPRAPDRLAAWPAAARGDPLRAPAPARTR